MHNYWWCTLLFRIFLPCIIASAGFLRPTITSYIYMVMGCYMPFFSVPTARTMAANTGNYMKLLVVVCILSCALVFSSYLVLYFPRGEEYVLEPCSAIEITIRTIGIVQYKDLPTLDLITWCLPEPLMLTTTMLSYFMFKKLAKSVVMSETEKQMDDTEVQAEMNRKKVLTMIVDVGKYLACFMLCATATLKATAFGFVYYVVFLGVLTYWACNQSLGKIYARILVCLIPVMFLNITVMIFYQLQYFQDSTKFKTTSVWGRLFNLVNLKTYKDCVDPRLFKIHPQSTSTYAIPVCVFILYHIIVLVARQILGAKDGIFSLLTAFFHFESSKDRVAKWRTALKKLQKQKEDSIATNVTVDRIKNILDKILEFIISISYLIANFMLMIWAIAYVGWKSLILLIWANLIWLLPARKKIMLKTSPILVIFMLILLISAYIYSMDLTEEELPSKIGPLDLRSGIYETGENKWSELLIKSLCGIIISIAMRQLWQERAINKQENLLKESLNATTSQTARDKNKSLATMDRLFKTCLDFLAIWWIWVVIITMIWMEFWSTSNLFRITFVGLAMLFLLTFQLLPFGLWKKFLSVYWWIVIIYALFNLLILYMYQLEETRGFLYKYVSEEMFHRFGFQVWTDTKDRFFHLLNPIFFQIAIVIQQNYLQTEFNRLTSPLTPEELAKQEKELAESDSKWSQIRIKFDQAKNVFFGVLEMHLQNIILLVGWLMCLFDLCAIFGCFVVLFTVACVLGRTFSTYITYSVSCLVQILIVLRLIYMNQYRWHHRWDYVGHYARNGKPYNVTLNGADWLGFHESRIGREYADFWQLVWCFCYVFIVSLNRIVTIRMKNYRQSRNLPTPNDIVIFPEITHENCHSSIKDMLKFLVDYGFYKFGCEITMIYASLVMGLRMDAVAIPMSVWLLIMFSLNRVWMKRLWLPGLIIVAIAVPLQYLSTLGWWPTFFDRSLTIYWNSNDFLLRTQQFCYLMNMAHPPAKEKISLDFMLLLIMSRQWLAFKREWKYRGENSTAGTNENVSHLIDEPNVKNPVPDYTTYTKSDLDSYKRIIFTTWFYLSLLAMFLAGTRRPTLYSFGYILGAFIILWEGADMFLRPPKSIMLRWNMLISYNILVMMTRNISQIFGCILKYESSLQLNCRLYRLFTIGCVDKYGMMDGIPNVNTTSSCDVIYEALGLGWDCFCFTCLILQQRIFKSYHFFHIVNDAKAHTILADRGAELIEEDRRKKRRDIDVQRTTVESNIKKKMEKLKANASKIEAIRAGEYQLFDQVEKDTDIPLLPPDEEEEEEYESFDPMPLTEYFGLFYSTDMATVLEITQMRSRRKKARRLKALGKPLPPKAPAKNSKPGTSKDPVNDQPTSKTRKTLNVLLFLWGAFESLVVSVVGLIDRRTKDFRSILNEMYKERKILKEKTNYTTQGLRLGSNKIWQPSRSYKDIISAQQKQAKEIDIEYSIYLKLLRALWYLIMTYSEWLCYFFIILNLTLTSNFIALPMSIMAFCWGALAVPKPTKTFWVVNIAYILIMVFLINLFNMGVSPWNKNSYRGDIFFPPYYMGLVDRDTVLNLLLLITFFFHRVVLQSLGLWKPYNYRIASLITDGDYNYKDGQLIRLTDGSKNPQALEVKSSEVSMGDYFPKSVLHGLDKYGEGFRLYIQQLVFPSSTQIPVDVYMPMFLCDLLNLFLLLFYYGSFQNDPKTGGIIEIITSNTVPMSYIVVVLVYFFLMVIDRGLYLRKNRFGKLIYHFFQVVGFHLWFFILYPMLTRGQVSDAPVVQAFYIFKCFYFLFSAYQIRNGYPILISYHYLWHGYTVFHRFGYKLYRALPYFIEIRCLLDWICSDSCLGLPAWFKLEDITRTLFDQKCQQEFEEKWSQPGGQPMNRIKKYIIGGFLYALLILTVIFPFLLFSLSSTMGTTTYPRKIKMELYMGSAEPVFVARVHEKDLKGMTQEKYENLTSTFNNVKTSEEVFGSFKPEDVLVVQFPTNSLTSWDISPGSTNELLEELEDKEEHFLFRLEIHYTHHGHGGKESEKTFGQSSAIAPLPDVQRQNLIDMLKSNESRDVEVFLPLIFPKFLAISREGKPKVIPIMEDPGENANTHVEMFSGEEDDDDDDPADARILRNILVTLRRSGKEVWWQVKEQCTVDDDNYLYYLKDLVHNDCQRLVLYMFNEKVFSEAFQFLTQSGILGLYLMYFMLISGIIRDILVDIDEIYLKDLPNANKMLRKCMELYVARDMKNYELEREIFEELICILRSHELLIKLTRYDDTKYDPTFITPGTSKK